MGERTIAGLSNVSVAEIQLEFRDQIAKPILDRSQVVPG
jgi:hypothetical protein